MNTFKAYVCCLLIGIDVVDKEAALGVAASRDRDARWLRLRNALGTGEEQHKAVNQVVIAEDFALDSFQHLNYNYYIS